MVSTLALDGWTQTIKLMLNNKYIIASEIDKGEIAIISIEDIHNPYIFSKLSFPDESSSSVCVTPD